MPETNIISDCERKNEPYKFTAGQNNVINSILCNFSSCAIYFSTTNINSKLLIECCSFSYDIRDGYGGAIYFGTTGEIVFSRVNGIYCSCNNNWGHFSYTVTKNSRSSLNYSSLSSCSTEKTGNHAFYFQYGCQEMSDTNISDCKGESAGFLYWKSSSKSFAQLSNFYNHTANYYSYAFIDIEFGVKTIKCNYIRNSVKYLISTQSGHIFVENCNIVNNKADALFYANFNGKITVINCCLYDNSYKYLTSGYKGYSFDLGRMNNGFCPQEFHFEPVSPVSMTCKAIIKGQPRPNRKTSSYNYLLMLVHEITLYGQLIFCKIYH